MNQRQTIATPRRRRLLRAEAPPRGSVGGGGSSSKSCKILQPFLGAGHPMHLICTIRIAHLSPFIRGHCMQSAVGRDPSILPLQLSLTIFSNCLAYS